MINFEQILGTYSMKLFVVDMFKDYPASQNIDENGFWIGNHATDMSLGIEKVHSVLKKVADAR